MRTSLFRWNLTHLRYFPYSGTTLHTNPLEFADISNYSYDSPPMLLSFFLTLLFRKAMTQQFKNSKQQTGGQIIIKKKNEKKNLLSGH